MYLIKANLISEKLNTGKCAIFHHLVAKSLFLCKRALPDNYLTVGLLFKNLKEPEVSYWKISEYCSNIWGTGMCIKHWGIRKPWSRYGGSMHRLQYNLTLQAILRHFWALGRGTTYHSSRKQKINGKSSTKHELIEVDDFIGSVLWTQIFMAAQENEVDKCVKTTEVRYY